MSLCSPDILIIRFSLDSDGPINLSTSYLEQKNFGKEYDMQHIKFQTLTVQNNLKGIQINGYALLGI